MTPEELQEVVAAVIAALKTNSKTIDQLTAVTTLADTDNLEISGGKKVSFGNLKELVASSVVPSSESIKGWVIIEDTDELPENPTQEEQVIGYLLDTTLYVYVGEGGDTLDGKYQSVDMQGPQGETGPAGADGHDGVDLGEVALVNNLTEGGEESALTAEQGKVLNEKSLVNATTNIETSTLPTHNCSLGSGKKWLYFSGAGAPKHIAIPVVAGKKYKLTVASTETTYGWYGWLSSSYSPTTTYTNNSTTPYVTGKDREWMYNGTQTFVAPTGASWLVCCVVDGTSKASTWEVAEITETGTTEYAQDVNAEVNSLQEYGREIFQRTSTFDLAKNLPLIRGNIYPNHLSESLTKWYPQNALFDWDNNETAWKFRGTGGGNYFGIRTEAFSLALVAGKQYTLSIDIKVGQTNKDIFIGLQYPTASAINMRIATTDTNWHTYTKTFTAEDLQGEIGATGDVQWYYIGFLVNSNVAGHYFFVKNFSLVCSSNITKDIDTLSKQVHTLDLTGKKISIIGDSISCFGTEAQTRQQGYNAPYWVVKSVDVGQQIQSYVTWLDVYNTINQGSTLTNKSIGGVTLTSAMIGTLQTFTPVAGDVGKAIGVARWAASYTDKPWWQIFIEKTGAVLCNNASWSGARIIPIPQGNERHDAFVLSEAYSDYTINRCSNRDDEGNVITPDIIFIYRGTNDFVATDPEGGGGANIPEDITTPDMKSFVAITDDYNFTQGYIWTILKLRQKYPNAYIILCTFNVFKYVNYSHFPSNNGTYTLPDYSNKVREIADLMGCGVVEFDKDGITFENCYPIYISDNAITPLHPNTNGHRVMGEKAVVDVKYYLKLS